MKPEETVFIASMQAFKKLHFVEVNMYVVSKDTQFPRILLIHMTLNYPLIFFSEWMVYPFFLKNRV